MADQALRAKRPPVVSYLATRFPPPLVLITAVTGLAAGLAHGSPRPVTLAAGAAGTALLFLGQRLADDIDDFERDSTSGTAPAGVTRNGMVLGYLAVVAVVALIGVPRPLAVLLGVGTLAAMWAGPVAARHGLTRLLPALFVVYEAVPFAIMVYPSTLAPAGEPIRWPTAMSTAVVLWCAYEFWKFSRKPGDAEYVPFGLGATGRTWAAAVFAATAALVGGLAGLAGVLPGAVAVSVAGTTAVFAVVATHQAVARQGRGLPPRGWPGLPMMIILPAVLAVSAAATA